MKIFPVMDIPSTLLTMDVFSVIVTPTSMPLPAPSCSTCFFAGKEHPLSVVLSPLTSGMPRSTTTIQSTTISLSMTTDSIAKITNYTADLDMKDIAVGNTSCVCACKYVNQTLDESLKRRSKELVLNKTKLSSVIRKLRITECHLKY